MSRLEEHVSNLVEDIGIEKLLELCDLDPIEAAMILIDNGYMELPLEWSLRDGENVER